MTAISTSSVNHLHACYRRLAAAVRPREKLTVSQWADRHRIISSKQSGLPGRWRTRINPVLEEIMDCLSTDSPAREVVIIKSNQVGVTEAMVNTLGYIMDHSPGPAMVLMPTLADRDAWKAQKINPLLKDTPVISSLLGGLKSRDAANRQDMIDFPGGILFLSGGNSPNSYAQRSVRWVFMDDLDRFPVEVGKEGDPVALARGRIKAFPHKYKAVFASTPTVQGASIIEREYQGSDQRRYFVPCPHCGETQPLEWNNVRFDRDNIPPVSAWYECRKCAEAIDEIHKPKMLAAGAWVPGRPGVKRRGYHLNALTSPIGLGPSWLDLARDWVGLHHTGTGKSRKAEPAKLKAFMNLHLGLTWEDRSSAVKPHHLEQRAEESPLGVIPPGILALTVGVDTQDTWLDVTLIGWRPWQDDGSPGWSVIDWHQIKGDTSRPAPWNELDAWIKESRPNSFGHHMKIHAVAIDNRGHRGEQVEAFVKRQTHKVPVFRVQGATGRQIEIISSTVKSPERDRRGKVSRGAYGIWNVGTKTAKDLIYSALSSDGDVPQAERRIRFPAGLPSEYWSGLLSEFYNQNTRKYEQRRGAEYKRNEPLDDLVYGIAIGYHREIMIGMRRTRVYRKAGGSQVMTVPDPAWWRRQARILESSEVQRVEADKAADPAAQKLNRSPSQPPAFSGFGSDEWVL